MALDVDGLALFLVEAKRNTYASQQGKVAPSRRGSKDLEYHGDRYYYRDSYLGELDFSGQEIVYRGDTAVWSMNYYGCMVRDDVPEGFIETLREALMKVDAGAPYRGCAHLRRGEFEYSCQSEGTPAAFSGRESISWRNEEVYRMVFHGGQIRYA